MSHERMLKTEAQLEDESAALLRKQARAAEEQAAEAAAAAKADADADARAARQAERRVQAARAISAIRKPAYGLDASLC
ncbi:MAG: hypothetical protein ACK587_07910 [Cyanobacteriota bacterium]|jgi:hypothetical protein